MSVVVAPVTRQSPGTFGTVGESITEDIGEFLMDIRDLCPSLLSTILK